MTRAVDLLKNKFGISQLYKHDVKENGEIILTIYWHPLTIAEREAIQKKTTSDDTNDYALQMMIEKSLDKEGKRIFQDGDKDGTYQEVTISDDGAIIVSICHYDNQAVCVLDGTAIENPLMWDFEIENDYDYHLANWKKRLQDFNLLRLK